MGIYAIIKKDIWVILLCSNNNDSAVFNSTPPRLERDSGALRETVFSTALRERRRGELRSLNAFYFSAFVKRRAARCENERRAAGVKSTMGVP